MTGDPSRRPDPPVVPEGGSDDGRRRRSAGRNLPAAIASGLALGALFLVGLLVEELIALALVMLLVGLALHELHIALRGRGLRPATPVVAGAGIVIVFGSYLHGPSALAVGLVLAVAGTSAWVLIAGRVEPQGGALAGAHPAGGVDAGDDPERVGTESIPAALGADLAASALMVCWVPLMAGFAGLLLDRPGGEWYLPAAIALSVSNDIGAYAFGNRFGRRKMAPHVSPAKTWEGFAGGLATVVLLAVAVTARGAEFTVGIAAVFGVAVVIASTAGDLTESLIKRDLGVKDLGSVIPGHGGVMDRVDGILFALPTAHVLLALFGL